VTKYRRFRHGEAVAYGMLAAAEIAVTKGLFPDAERDRLSMLIAQLGPLPSVLDLSVAEVLAATRRDKKIVSGRLHVVLPTTIGRTVIVDDVTEDDFRRALKAIGLR